MNVRTRAIAGLLVLGLIVPVSALAQERDTEESSSGDPTVRARRLFAQGVACAEQHETACAERAFREALTLRDAPAIRYNLASALYDLSRYPEAARLTASVLADESTPAGIRTHAEELQGQLQANAGTLALRYEGDGEVRVDGEPIPRAQREAVLVAPGTRVVAVFRGDEQLLRRAVPVERGGRVEVDLSVPSPEEAAAQAEPAETPQATVALVDDWRFWLAIGAAAAALVVVAVIVGVVVGGTVEAPIEGNYAPGVLRW